MLSRSRFLAGLNCRGIDNRQPMRLLFSFIGGRGHFDPLLPLAEAARAAGHVVRFACSGALQDAVTGAGFDVHAYSARPAAPPTPQPLRPVDAARELREFRERFVQAGARHRYPLARALCEGWRPGCVIADEADFGAVLAAEALGIPCARVQVMATAAFVPRALAAGDLAQVRTALGLPADEHFPALDEVPLLTAFPATLRDPALPPARSSLSFRAPPPRRPLPLAGFDPRPGWPTVYLTLGTVFHLEAGDLLARAMAGLHGLPVNAIVTTGEGIDPAALGPHPAHWRVAAFLPQAEVLPHCDLLLCHAGSGGLLGAITHGLPLVTLAMGADQLLNAERCAALGLGLPLDPLTATPAEIAAAVRGMLADARARIVADRLRAEAAAHPPAAEALAALLAG